MSGIFGIYNRNGKPVDKEIVNTMLEGMSYWQPDDRGTWSYGPVALGHTMLWNTPESKFEQLPNKQGHVVITMDARLDNREELVKQLDMSDRPLDQITESDFIVEAYHKWGEECPKYLLGDFAFAIWDEKKQQLFCARDHVGVKQLYFHLTDTLFVFANDLKGLVTHPDITKEINDEAVANYIVYYQLLSTTLTFFKEIEKLPPAHILTVAASGVQKKCYWRLEDAPRVSLPDAEAYAGKLRELFTPAVYNRIRSAYPVTSHLSGGLDSSTIAVLAARKLREKGESLLAFNWVHEPTEDDDPTHYEWSNSRTIAEAEGIEHHYVTLTVDKLYNYMRNHAIAYGDTAIFWYEFPVRKAAQTRGSRTILSGWGGDELTTYHGQSYYANLFLQGNFWKVCKELRARVYKKQKGVKPILSAFYHHVLMPLVPRKLYCKMPKITCPEPVFPLVKKMFLPVINKELKKSSILTMQPQQTIREHMLAYWQNGHIQSRIESWAAAGLPNRLEYSYPLLDKQIIEFIVGVPAEYFVNNGVGRSLFRSAADGILPDEILWTNAKQELNRVDRLASLITSSCKLFVANGEISGKPSDYIDNAKLRASIEKLEVDSIDRNASEMIKDVGTSLSVIFFGRFS